MGVARSRGSHDVGTGVTGGQILESCWQWATCTMLPWESLGVGGQMMLARESLGSGPRIMLTVDPLYCELRTPTVPVWGLTIIISNIDDNVN